MYVFKAEPIIVEKDNHANVLCFLRKKKQPTTQ